MDVFDFFASHGVDLKNKANGSLTTKCPKCHDERKKKGTKELQVNIDFGWFKCYNCGYEDHILKQEGDHKHVDFTPKAAPKQKFISPEPVFNWIIPDAVIEPKPVKPLVGKYHITWYYRNINDKLTGAKKMAYDFTEAGFNRIKDDIPLHLFTRDSGYYPCLFYERDLYLFPHATVILLESEKTAAILRKRFKSTLNEFIYIATGGANGLTDEKAKVLAGRNILICYDCDNGDLQPDGTIKAPKGREGAQTALTKLNGISKAKVVDVNPELTDGSDLADIDIDIDGIRKLTGTNKYPPELVNDIQKLNMAGDYWTSEIADQLGQTHLVNHKDVFAIGRVYYEANQHEFAIEKAPLLKKIEYFLLKRFDFRRNSINKKIFYRDKSIRDSEFTFCNYNDIWRLLQHNLHQFGTKSKINITDVSNLLESEFVEQVNPFQDYFHTLPHWDGADHITNLANYIQTTDQPFWVEQFKKALVRMIACSYGNIENRIIMVLIQSAQEQGKDSFLRYLCPPELREYYKEDPMDPNKDTEIALCQNFMWNLTELDQLNKKEISAIKGIISRATVKQRKSYGRQEETMIRVVNFWGTTNKEEFLTDTQNTRWLCFQINSISHSYNDYIKNIREIDIQKVWAQAWSLYKSGYLFQLTEKEREKRDIINHNFEVLPIEKELILKYITQCDKDTENAEFITVAEILEYLMKQTDRSLRLSPENIGRCMTQLGFTRDIKKVNNKSLKGYWALRQALKLNQTQHQSYQQQESPVYNEVPGLPEPDPNDLPF